MGTVKFNKRTFFKDQWFDKDEVVSFNDHDSDYLVNETSTAEASKEKTGKSKKQSRFEKEAKQVATTKEEKASTKTKTK